MKRIVGMTAEFEKTDKGSDNKGSVFVSYSRLDFTVAETVRDALIAEGIDAYLDRFDIAPGEDWQARIGSLIAAAEKVVFLISPSSIASRICQWEIDQTERLGKSLLPVLVRDTDPALMPGRLSRLNFLDMCTDEKRKSALGRLVVALRLDLAWEREKTRIGALAE